MFLYTFENILEVLLQPVNGTLVMLGAKSPIAFGCRQYTASSHEGLPQRTPPYHSLRYIGQPRLSDCIDCTQFSRWKPWSLIEYNGETGGCTCP